LLALVTVLGGGAAFAAVESNTSTWDGVWWALTTMTTAGSNTYPVTVLGRLIGMTVMIVGIGFIAILTGAVAQRFLTPQLEQIAELDSETAAELDTAETDILNEVREIRARLGRVEEHLERQAVKAPSS
jgi:voltage-gated potassium channel